MDVVVDRVLEVDGLDLAELAERAHHHVGRARSPCRRAARIRAEVVEALVLGLVGLVLAVADVLDAGLQTWVPLGVQVAVAADLVLVGDGLAGDAVEVQFG